MLPWHGKSERQTEEKGSLPALPIASNHHQPCCIQGLLGCCCYKPQLAAWADLGGQADVEVVQQSPLRQGHFAHGRRCTRAVLCYRPHDQCSTIRHPTCTPSQSIPTNHTSLSICTASALHSTHGRLKHAPLSSHRHWSQHLHSICTTAHARRSEAHSSLEAQLGLPSVLHTCRVRKQLEQGAAQFGDL